MMESRGPDAWRDEGDLQPGGIREGMEKCVRGRIDVVSVRKGEQQRGESRVTCESRD